ncbi:hypothetical protein CTI12_AA505850 [Artemisia annua]|uniref:C2 domain-containing protein n=1 Tax=Artemisia annua TaxID=35608 RepID=A0A2U1LCT5_ARTAN|nr:hypothetical protein CTI12_AA505850 [Artemisia annua]
MALIAFEKSPDDVSKDLKSPSNLPVDCLFKQEIGSGTEEEVELRACSIYTVEKMRDFMQIRTWKQTERWQDRSMKHESQEGETLGRDNNNWIVDFSRNSHVTPTVVRNDARINLANPTIKLGPDFEKSESDPVNRLCMDGGERRSKKKQKKGDIVVVSASKEAASSPPRPWQNMVENLQLAHQKLSVIVDLINTMEARTQHFNKKFVFSLIEGLRELNIIVWISNTLSHDDFIGSGKVQLAKVLSCGYEDSSWPLKTKLTGLKLQCDTDLIEI